MVITPDSSITLYKDIPIENGLQLAFSSKAKQKTYFNSKIVRQELECTMVKKNLPLQISAPMSIVSQCNYLSFVNPSLDNRVYYAMITDYEYVNNECTLVAFSIDWFQTYMFDLDFKSGSSKAREGLSQKEWNDANSNPFTPDVYPLTTPEDLAYGDSIEPPSYNYSAGWIPSAHVANNIKEFSKNYDGFYLADISNPDALSEWADGYGLYVVITLAPIDFSEISEDVYTDWVNLMGLVRLVGGYYITATDEYNSSNYDLLNNQMRAANIIAFPSAILLPDNSSLLPESGHPVNEPNQLEARLLFQKIIDSLTYLNAISQIVSIYTIPALYVSTALIDDKSISSTTGSDEAGSVYPSGFPMIVNRVSNLGYGINSPKLYRHPYSYLRVESPDLASKEYKFEDFYDLAYLPYANTNRYTTGFRFRMYSSIEGEPHVYLTPWRYKMNTTSFPNESYSNEKNLLSSWKSLNHAERMEFADFPMVPFNTDGYLTFISNQIMSTTKANTADFRDQISLQKLSAATTAGNTMTNLLGGVLNTASGSTNSQSGSQANVVGNAASTLSGTFSGVTDFTKKAVDVQSKEAQLAEAEKYFSGIGGPNIDYGRYNDTKPAYANNIYHAGSTPNNVVMRGVGNYWFKFTYVRPRLDIIKKYDDYFTYYGYNQAGRVGKPLVANYIAGETSTELIPHWENTDEGSSFYTQTMNCEVTGAPLPVLTFIKSLFNNGVRFLKGDAL